VSISSYIKALRASKGWSQQQLSIKSGVPRSTISLIELKEGQKPRYDVLEKLAQALGVSTDYLLGKPPNRTESPNELWERLKAYQPISVPIKGIIPAGTPTAIEETDLGYVYVPRDLLRGKKDVYALEVSGESLAGDGIYPGDYAVVDPNATVVNGKIYVVRIGHEVVARHIEHTDGSIRLRASNGEYRDLSPAQVEVLGRVMVAGRWNEF